MNYVIGVDAGGTKTKAHIVNEDLEVIFEAEAGYGNPNIDFDQASLNIWSTISQCLNSRHGSFCKSIVVGAAGIEAGNNKERIYEHLKKKTKLPLIIVNDAVLAYYSFFGLGNGVLTIAGTGSISYGRNGEHEEYAGGWGHILGDEGSSYDIAIQACKMMIKEKESNISPSCLSKVILTGLEMNHISELKGFIYKSTKDQIASISYIVYLEAKKGDRLAQKLFFEAGEKLAEQTLNLISKLKLAPIAVACSGSLLEENQFVKQAFHETINNNTSYATTFLNKKYPSTVGAYSIVKKAGF